MIRRVILYSLLSILLFADSGQMLYTHICLESGTTTFSLNASKHCCSDEESEAETCRFSQSCCYDAAKYIKQAFFNFGEDTKPAPVAQAPAFELPVFQKYSDWEIHPAAHPGSSPPLPSHKQHLSLLQVYRC